MRNTKKILSIGILFALFLSPAVYAQDAPETLNSSSAIEQNAGPQSNGLFPVLDENVDTPIVQLAVPPTSEWEISPLETFGVRWVIRAKEALNWALNAKASSNHSPAIEATHNKVLSIVNGLFIIGLLAIAAMWMFSLLIPRKQLQRVMLVYAGAVVFVNFALPFNQLLVDATQVLQRTLLTGPEGSIVITDLIQTPDYTKSVVYENTPEELAQGKSVTHQVKIGSPDENGTGDVSLATVQSPEKTLIGSLIQGNELGQFQFNIPESNDETVNLNTQEAITFEQTVENTSINENQVFAFGLMMATGFAYFAMAMVLVLRLVMLWALLILSPALLLLAIFNSTRGWFLQWVAVYGRWLMIGPLLALGLSVVINLWQLTGSPVEMEPFSGQNFMQNPISTLAFYLPGHSEPNTLANTSQVMEYLLFLVMLYVPLFFAFALTRQKAVHAIGTWLKDYGRALKKSTTVIIPQGQQNTRIEEHASEGNPSLVQQLQDTVSHKIKQFTQAAMPIRSDQEEKKDLQKTLMAALPLSDLLHQIKVDGPKKGNESVTENKAVLEKLAFPERSVHSQEHQQLMSIRHEIEKRAQQGHEDAQQVWANIQAVQNQTPIISTPQPNEASGEWNFHEQTEDQRIVRHEENAEEKTSEPTVISTIQKETEIREREKDNSEAVLVMTPEKKESIAAEKTKAKEAKEEKEQNEKKERESRKKQDEKEEPKKENQNQQEMDESAGS